MNMILVVGQFDINAEDAQAAAQLMRVMMTESMKEQGCHHYAYSLDLATPNRFQLSERWEDDAALAAHFHTDHMAVYRAGMSKLRIEKRTVKRYEGTNAEDL